MEVYVNSFEEIKSWSRQEQLNILYKSKYRAFKEMPLFLHAMACFLASVAIGIIVAVTPQFWIQIHPFIDLLFTPVGIWIAIYIFIKLYVKVIHKSLVSVLNKKNS